MEEKDLQQQEQQQSESGKKEGASDNGAYIEAINEMKRNTVSRESYEKLQKDNQMLLKSLIDGKPLEGEQVLTTDTDREKAIKDLRTELFGKDRKDLNNLEFWSKTLELRNHLIDSGEQDPFLPTGKLIAPTQEDIDAANKVASIVKECIDVSNGDSQFFTNELMRRTVDTPNLVVAKKTNNPYRR